MHSKRDIHVVCGIIVNAQREVVIGRRAVTGSFPGMWEFPGGKCEPGESHQQALIRELAEELGITVVVKSPFTTVKWCDSAINLHLHPFECELVSGVLQCLVHEELRWSNPQQWHLLEWAPADVPIWREWLSREGLFREGLGA